MKHKNKKEDFLVAVLVTLGASLLVNLLVQRGVIRAGKGKIRTGENF